MEEAAQFLIERAQAIDQYAGVEQSLSMLFSDLLGTSFELGGIVFFRISNATSRNAILEQLLSKKYGEAYEVYWNGIRGTPHKRGLFTLLRQLHERRNEIVHWHTVNNIHTDGTTHTVTLTLTRPNFWTSDTQRSYITAEDMREFSAKASFVSRSINTFTMVATHRFPDGPRDKHGSVFFKNRAFIRHQQIIRYFRSRRHPESQLSQFGR